MGSFKILPILNLSESGFSGLEDFQDYGIIQILPVLNLSESGFSGLEDFQD